LSLLFKLKCREILIEYFVGVCYSQVQVVAMHAVTVESEKTKSVVHVHV